MSSNASELRHRARAARRAVRGVPRLALVTALVLAIALGIQMATTPGPQSPVTSSGESFVGRSLAPLRVKKAPAAAAAAGRPNIILIMTDDMNRSDLRYMPATLRLLRDRGVTVADFISNHPLCCPARAETLTGQYAQNNGVRSNDGPHGGYRELSRPLDHVGAWLQAAGYPTAIVGKYLNGWNGSPDPGWTVFDPILRGVYRPYGLRMYDNGHPRLYSGVYTTDLISRLTVRYIRRFAAAGTPFFIWSTPVAPHAMVVNGDFRRPLPAPRHRALYPHAMPPSLRDPSFNEANVSDKPPFVRHSARRSRTAMIADHRARIRSLRAVDEQVSAIVEALRDTGELASTYLFFTSDNGLLLGEHRLTGKNAPYEPALRVPLVVRGPGLPAGVVRHRTYGMVDLAPTFVDLASARAGRRMDGRSMMATLRSGAPGYRAYLIQAGRGRGPWFWRGVRSHRYVYVRYGSGFQELYDRVRDPAELVNRAHRPAYQHVRAEYAALLRRLATCAGATCRTG